MNEQKIAILVDTCCDVPMDMVKAYGMYVLPVKIIYHDREYLDGIDITAEEVYRSFDKEIPKTSLPSGEYIEKTLRQIQKDGYEKVLAITLSSGLSGTNNIVSLVAQEFKGLDIFVLDTKNIAIGSGFHAIQAARYIEMGLSFEEIIEKLQKGIPHSKVFFVVSTLEYLQKGGRIGLVASLFGNALNLKPIISCNEEGIYYTVAKVRGRKQSISRLMEIAKKEIAKYKHYNIAIVHGDAQKAADEVIQQMKEQLPGMEVFVEGQISPVLGVHTGPGLVGIAVQGLD